MDIYRDESRTSSQTSHLNGGHSQPCLSQDLPTESMSTEWTDEKHSLYLKSMEASFVNQLHNSMDLLQLQKEMSNPESYYATPSQFKVLRRGCWQRVSLRRPESEVQRTNGCRDFLRSPWIQHFRSVRKPRVIESLPLQENGPISSDGKEAVSSGLGCCSKHSLMYSHRQVLIDSKKDNVEMSDQNFVDEDATAEKANCTSSSKRMKTNASNGDQVVPIGKLPLAEDIAEKKSPQN